MNNRIAYFKTPTQVEFYADKDVVVDSKGNLYVNSGIAFHDYIICGCCGKVIKISKIYEQVEVLKAHKIHGDKFKDFDPIVPLEGWKNLNWIIKDYEFDED